MNLFRLSTFLLAAAFFLFPTAAVQAGNYALVVGVNKYINSFALESLQYAENDAEELGAVLKTGGFNKVTVMSGSAENDLLIPGKDNIIRELDNLLQEADSNRDVVIVAFAGHGVKFDWQEGDTLTPKFYFCPTDADLKDYKTESEPMLNRANNVAKFNKLIELDEIYAKLEACEAGTKLLLVDACRNDPSKVKGLRAAKQQFARRNAARRDFSFRTLPQLQETEGGIAAMFSCSPGQFAYEFDELKHGVFFHNVILALKGEAVGRQEGKVTLTDFFGYVQDETKNYIETNYHGEVIQNPIYKTKISTNPILTFVSIGGARNTKPGTDPTQPIVPGLPDPLSDARTPHPLLVQGKSSLQENSFDSAIQAFTTVIKTSSDKATLKEAYAQRGTAYAKRGGSSDIDRALFDKRAAEEPGVTLTVKASSASVRVISEEVGKVKKGQAVIVSHIEGDFLWVVEIDGSSDVKGYIQRDVVLPQPKIAQAAPIPRSTLVTEPAQLSSQPVPFHRPTTPSPRAEWNSNARVTSGPLNDRFIDEHIRRTGSPPSHWQTPKWESPAEIRRLREAGRIR